MMHLDTSFLVDLLREGGRDRGGPAIDLLEELAGEELRLSVHVVCELHAGVELSRRPSAERQRVQQLCRGLAIVYPDDRFHRPMRGCSRAKSERVSGSRRWIC